MKNLFYLIIVIAIAYGCSSQNGLSQYENTEIIFGSGGGFSGQTIEYHINAEREITSTNSLTKETTSLGKLSKSKTRQLFEELSGLNLALKEFNQPGNMYYYVKESKGNKEAQVLWGEQSDKVPEGVKEYYEILMSIVKEKN